MKSFILILTSLTALLNAQEKKNIQIPDTDEAAYPAIERFISVLEMVRKNHPDADKLAYERLVNHALEGMLSSLDPHSSFIHPEMVQATEGQKDIDSHVPSLGFSIGMREGGPYVMAVTRFGSADQSKILPDSSLLAVDNTDLTKSKLSDVLSSLNKPAGSVSLVKIKSPLDPKPIEIKLVHFQVPDKAIVTSQILPTNKEIGYIRLAEFTAHCDKELDDAIETLQEQGMKSLILDLRGNPGGRLDATVRLLGLFLPPDTEVVSVRSRTHADQSLRTPKEQRQQLTFPICILIDRMSASAAELTAAAMQDLKRATIIGETSYGKGSVQQIIPMGRTALRLTVETYHGPSGRTPHNTGVAPDISVTFSETDRANCQLQLRPDALTPEQQQQIAKWQDPAVEHAVKQLNATK